MGTTIDLQALISPHVAQARRAAERLLREPNQYGPNPTVVRKATIFQMDGAIGIGGGSLTSLGAKPKLFWRHVCAAICTAAAGFGALDHFGVVDSAARIGGSRRSKRMRRTYRSELWRDEASCRRWYGKYRHTQPAR